MKTIKQILQFIIGLLLLVVALFTIKYTFLIGMITIVIANIYKRRFLEGLVRIGTVFTAGAYCIDVLGCVILQVPLGYLFIKEGGGHRFGSKYETISYVLGKNQASRTLTKVGRGLVAFLNFLEKDHCLKAVNIKDEIK